MDIAGESDTHHYDVMESAAIVHLLFTASERGLDSLIVCNEPMHIYATRWAREMEKVTLHLSAVVCVCLSIAVITVTRDRTS